MRSQTIRYAKSRLARFDAQCIYSYGFTRSDGMYSGVRRVGVYGKGK